MLYRDVMGLGRDEIRQFRRNPCCFNGGEAKKPGQMISKGHKNYDLMLNLQLGIRSPMTLPSFDPSIQRLNGKILKVKKLMDLYYVLYDCFCFNEIFMDIDG
ncbi:hypothetical protein L6452_19610 [Arctium lappa]|uniref:Uncharacterized protein n=1 Tax=Arctium lappa TaxID=4217 RepID=A0ACB9BAW0_ARCLA|nr:hypothetical protein L6452_19610 [Arctium lappa]